MSILDRIENALRARYGAQTPPGQPGTGATLPPGVYVQQAPRQRMSRSTLLLVGGVVALALYFVMSASHSAAPPPKKPSEFPGADIDKSGIGRVMDSLKTDAQKSKEAADRALAAQEAILRAQQQSQPPAIAAYPGGPPLATPGMPPGQTATAATALADPLLDERKKKAYTSLFSNPIIKLGPEPESHPNGTQNKEEVDLPGTIAARITPAQPTPAATTVAGTPSPSNSEQPRNCFDQIEPGNTPLYALCEGSIIEARLANRLVGDFSGPVIAIVERDQYSRDRQHLLIPKGAQLLGEAQRVSSSFDNRLSVSFHRMLLPDGSGRNLNSSGLDAAGETALKDTTDYHVKSTVLTTLALGGLAGFATAGTGGLFTATGVDAYRQGISQQAGQTGQQLIGRTLNRPPTITIREGHPVLIYVHEDLHLPDYVPAVPLGSR